MAAHPRHRTVRARIGRLGRRRLAPRTLVHARTFLDDQATWFLEGSLAELPQIDGNPEYFILGRELEPGDAVFFNMATLHAAGGVSGDRRRRVLSLRFVGEQMRHAPRPWTISPPFPGLADDLPEGAPLDHPLFPVLWGKQA